MDDAAHRRAHTAKGAVWLADPQRGNLSDASARPLEELDEQGLSRLVDSSKTGWIRTLSPGGDDRKHFCQQSGPVSELWLVLEVWLVREDGKLKIAGVLSY